MDEDELHASESHYDQVEDAAWEAIDALLVAAGAAIVVDGVVRLSEWPDDAWDAGGILASMREVFTDILPADAADVADIATYVDSYIDDREQLIVRAGEEVFEQVRTRVDVATAAGLSEAELADVVSDITNPDTDDVDWRSRSQRIARTEVHGAEQGAQWAWMDSRVEAGLIDPPLRRWITAADERVREDHVGVQSVEWPQPFDVGGELLRYPGDSRGSASNVINCRCAAITQTLLK